MEKSKSNERKASSTTKLIAVLVIGILVGAAIGYYSASFSAAPSTAKTVTYTIGLASDLSSTGASFGEETLTSAQLAISDINSYLARSGSGVTFALSVQDSLSTTDGAVSAIKTLASAGYTIVLCHCWSGQLSAVESFAQSNKMLILDVSSTSNLLAVPKQDIYRLIAPDSFQGKALTTLIWDKGVRKVVVIYRNDAYGQGISGVFKTDFTGLGGNVVLEAYQGSLADYASEVTTLSSNVQSLGVGPQTGVLFIGFASEAVNIFTHASTDNTLTHVTWFSSEGPKGPDIIPPKVPASIGAFETQTNLTGTFPQSIVNNTIAINFLNEFQAKTGHTIFAYGEQAYDGIWLLANTILAVGSYNATAVNNLLPTLAQHMMGASGPMQMDSNGDRASQDYAVWTIVNTQGTYAFENIGGWAAATGTVTFSS